MLAGLAIVASNHPFDVATTRMCNQEAGAGQKIYVSFRAQFLLFVVFRLVVFYRRLEEP